MSFSLMKKRWFVKETRLETASLTSSHIQGSFKDEKFEKFHAFPTISRTSFQRRAGGLKFLDSAPETI